MGLLVLVRHGQSEWNALDKWTGKTDVALTKQGEHEASCLANELRDLAIDVCFCSSQKRAKHTLEIILRELNKEKLPLFTTHELNERDYGELTGVKRTDVIERYGKKQFMLWRRSWSAQPPGGESLKDVSERVLPFYTRRILPILKSGQNVLVVAHGNSLRALIKNLDSITDDNISKVEMLFNEIIIYEIDENGVVKSKKLRNSAV